MSLFDTGYFVLDFFLEQVLDIFLDVFSDVWVAGYYVVPVLFTDEVPVAVAAAFEDENGASIVANVVCTNHYLVFEAKHVLFLLV